MMQAVYAASRRNGGTHPRNSDSLETESQEACQHSDGHHPDVGRWQEVDIFRHTNQFPAMHGA